MIFASFLAFSASGAAQETSTPKFEIGLNAVDSGSQHDAASAFNSTKRYVDLAAMIRTGTLTTGGSVPPGLNV